MSKRPEKNSSGAIDRMNDRDKDTRGIGQNRDPSKTMRAETENHQPNTSEETESEEKILPMSDREEKMINYREQVEEMRRRIKFLEDENSSFKRHLPWKTERPKTAIYPIQNNRGSDTTELSKQRDDIKFQLCLLQEENVKLCSEKDALGTRLKKYENELNSVKEENRIATETIAKLKQENADVYNRLSEMASVQLTHGNTDIVDLSDKNRPTKLVEKMVEIYDYQWTEALEELGENDFKDDPTQLLLKIIMESHLACKELTWNRYHKMTEDCSKIILPGQLNRDAEGEDKDAIVNVNLTLDQKRLIKDLCFGTLQSSESEIRTRLINLVEVKTNFSADRTKKTRKYLEDCIELCWRMTRQEKPMHLDPTVEIKDGQKYFDNEKFRSYTKTGQYVDFVVWPALYLFEGGPLLQRGIAQGLCEKES